MSSPQLPARGGHPLRHIMCTPFTTMGELHVSLTRTEYNLHLFKQQGRFAPELQYAGAVVRLSELHLSYSEVLYDLFITRVRCMQLSILKQPAQQEGGECCCAQPCPAVHDACCALSPCFARCLINSAVHRMPCCAQCLTYLAVHHALLSSIVAGLALAGRPLSAADTLPQPMSLAS